MNKEIKEKWVAALRSGEYEQARKKLYYAGGYCCLGVLCVVADSKFGEWEIQGTQQFYKDAIGSIWTTNLPNSLASEFNIDQYSIDVLVRMNDVDLATFDEIADYIEKYL